MMPSQNLKPATLILLVAAVLLVWGFSWPIMKLTLANISALWMSAFRLGIGCLAMFTLIFCTGHRFFPTKKDLPLLLSVGLAQMGGFTLLITLGLTHVEAGRSAILAYTTPLWVTPIAVLFFKEHLSKMGLAGLIIGIIGMLFLFDPTSFNWNNHAQIIGNGLLLLAALVWSLVIIHVRFGTHYHSPLALAPWQLLVGFLFVTLVAYIFDPHPSINWSWSLIAELAYLGPFAMAFAYWGMVEMSKNLPAIYTSLLLLGVPVIGLLSSAVILSEAIDLDTFMAMVLILTGISCVVLSKGKN
jgi:drug/metabolite transporter (DMT)-like permease